LRDKEKVLSLQPSQAKNCLAEIYSSFQNKAEDLKEDIENFEINDNLND
jgi:hypothetical protein